MSVEGGFLNAVLDEDLQGLLRSIGQLEPIERGEVICVKCGAPITLENLQLIIPMSEGKYHIVCNTSSCIEQL
jgi:hypothetical protein